MKLHQLEENELTFRNEIKNWEQKFFDEQRVHQMNMEDLSMTIQDNNSKMREMVMKVSESERMHRELLEENEKLRDVERKSKNWTSDQQRALSEERTMMRDNIS